MAEEKRIFPVGRIVLIVGAGVLLLGVFLPWFHLGGTNPQLPAGDYTGVGLTNLLNDLAKGPYAWAAFAWLVVVVVLAVVAALMGRKFSNFGTSGVLVLVLYAILIYVAANLSNQSSSSGSGDVSFAYGFFPAIIGAALIETETRMAKPKPMAEAPPAAAGPAK